MYKVTDKYGDLFGYYDDEGLIDICNQYKVNKKRDDVSYDYFDELRLQEINGAGEIVDGLPAHIAILKQQSLDGYKIFQKSGAVIQWNSGNGVEYRDPSNTKNSKLAWAKEVLTKIAGYAITEDA